MIGEDRGTGPHGRSPQGADDMFFAADYPFLNIFWTMIIFFAWVIWIWMVVGVLTDVFARQDLSGSRRPSSCSTAAP
jgi:hypothetical protein